MDEPVLRSQLRPGVVPLTLSRPDKLNAMSQPLVAALGRQLRELADDAGEALGIGLVTSVTSSAALAAEVGATLGALLSAPPLSLSLTKQGMWLALENRQQVLTSLTADADEAMAFYRARRPAQYRNQ